MATVVKDRKTPVFDWEKGDFVTDISGVIQTVTGMQAAEQIIIKAQTTTRGRFTIYQHTENPKLDHKYGSDAPITLTRPGISDAVRLSEIKRNIAEAIVYDPFILDVVDVLAYRLEGDEVYTAFTAVTIFDKKPIVVEGVLAYGAASI